MTDQEEFQKFREKAPTNDVLSKQAAMDQEFRQLQERACKATIFIARVVLVLLIIGLVTAGFLLMQAASL